MVGFIIGVYHPQNNKGKQMEKLTGHDVLKNEALAIDWRKQVSYFLYVAANHDTDTTEFQEALEHLQTKHNEWIFNNGN